MDVITTDAARIDERSSVIPALCGKRRRTKRIPGDGRFAEVWPLRNRLLGVSARQRTFDEVLVWVALLLLAAALLLVLFG
jgi:hypothetical protein